MELLELYLSPVNERRFQAIATQRPNGVGDGSAEGDLPFWVGDRDWRRTVIKILEDSGEFRLENFPEAGEQDWLVRESILHADRQHFHSAYLQRIGQSLYQSLFPSDSSLKQAFQYSLRLAEQRHTDLHLCLKFAADSAKRSRLADYPWELLHDGQRFLLHQKVRLSRYIAYESSPPRFLGQEQIRVLLFSARPQGLPQLSSKEQQAVRNGLQRASDAGSVQLQLLPSPTRKELNRYLTDCSPEQLPHILHFDGHGVFGKRCTACSTMHPGIKAEFCKACERPLPDPYGYLVFETENGAPDYVSAKQFAALLEPYGVGLVVLSACQSGMAVAGSVFNGMAQNLIDQRIPAVVAMQYSLRADVACDFVEQFYRVLGKKESLLMALNQGIRAMDVEGNQWYRPVLYLRWQDNQGGQLFNPTVGSQSPKLSLSKRLQVDHWTTELADSERDYETVKAQLRTELDGPTQNRLKLKLELIAQDIDRAEQMLQQLEQGNG